MNKELYNLLMDKQPEDKGLTLDDVSGFLTEAMAFGSAFYRVSPPDNPDNPPERIEFSNPSSGGYTVYYPPSREDFLGVSMSHTWEDMHL